LPPLIFEETRMAQYELIMPKMGESVAEATITNWLKSEGDTIEADESVLEIATDKVDSEVPSPVDGVLEKMLFDVNDVVQVGQPIAIINTGGGDAPGMNGSETAVENTPAETPEPAEVEAVAETVETAVATAGSNGSSEKIARSSNGRFYSPLVRSIAETEGISQTELDAINGTGLEGRVTKKDILSYIDNRGSALVAKPTEAKKAAAPASQPGAPAPKPALKSTGNVPVYEGDELIEMDRMRKIIAENMVLSKQTAPHVTSFVEADVTNIVKWRNKVKNEFQSREGEKITFTPIFIEALVKAIKDFPMINISLDGDKIIKRKSINMGMAAALPSGNLIVPVIKNADQLNLVGLTKKVNDLAKRARENKLQPDEISGGTYTITNVGTFGNVLGTPIIPLPQVAIMATGAIVKKPSVIETPDGDMIGIRHKMFLSHSYDHRIVDGALGGMFVRRVADYLEAWDVNREI
jgi:2-oxoglutarate dehydrogenase E2 component (dihydrolipoamide succinyltransferase)